MVGNSVLLRLKILSRVFLSSQSPCKMPQASGFSSFTDTVHCIPVIRITHQHSFITRPNYCCYPSDRFGENIGNTQKLDERNDSTEYEDGQEPCPRGIVLLDEERVAGQQMLQRIVKEYEQQGISFMLPFNDEVAISAIIDPIRKLLEIGVQPEFFVDACVSIREFFMAIVQKGSICIEVIDLLVDHCGMTFEDSIRFFAIYVDELLTKGTDEVRSCLEVLTSLGIGYSAVGMLVRSVPALIFAQSSAVLSQNAENLYSHLSKSQLRNVVKSSPAVLLCNSDEVNDKIEYAYCHMLMDGEDFEDCKRFSEVTLNELIDRHEFLLKCGVYKTPDPRRPQLKMSNPTFKKIIDSYDEYFATEVAQCSLEEWQMFRQIQENERRLKSEGKIRAFERIKPSMRKKFEQRFKQNKADDVDTFESAGDRY